MSKKEKQKNKTSKVLIGFIVILFVVFGGLAAYAALLTNTAKDVVEESHEEIKSRTDVTKSDKREEKVDPTYDNISILFLGIDDNGSGVFKDHARTDAMLLATFNEKDKSVKMTSIPRDSRVKIVEKNRMDKITHAHAYGGIDMAVNTVEQLFDIPVDYYVRMNFTAFMDIVNALGGIEVDVPFNIVEEDSERNQNVISIKKGLQTLTGEEALAYVRTRKYDGDIQRGERQQEVLKAMIKKGLSVQNIGKYNGLMKKVGENLTTNLAFDEIVSLHDYALEGSNLNIESLKLEGRNARIDGLYYYVLKDESIHQISDTFKQHLELTQTAESDLDDNESS